MPQPDDQHSVWVRPPVPARPMTCPACDVAWERTVTPTCWSCGAPGLPARLDRHDGLVA